MEGRGKKMARGLLRMGDTSRQCRGVCTILSEGQNNSRIGNDSILLHWLKEAQSPC